MKKILKPTAFTFALSLIAMAPNSSWANELWHINNCTIEASARGVKLQTNGELSGDKLFFRILTPESAQNAPDVFLTALNDPLIHVEGINKSFSFELLYTPLYAAKMMSPKAEIGITYTDHAGYEYTNTFPTQNLPKLLSDLATKKGCHQQPLNKRIDPSA